MNSTRAISPVSTAFGERGRIQKWTTPTAENRAQTISARLPRRPPNRSVRRRERQQRQVHHRPAGRFPPRCGRQPSHTRASAGPESPPRRPQSDHFPGKPVRGARRPSCSPPGRRTGHKPRPEEHDRHDIRRPAPHQNRFGGHATRWRTSPRSACRPRPCAMRHGRRATHGVQRGDRAQAVPPVRRRQHLVDRVVPVDVEQRSQEEEVTPNSPIRPTGSKVSTSPCTTGPHPRR